jgi:phosphatidate phosphatase PAH1
MSPDRLFSSLKREVIDRQPYVFKIAALRKVRQLFPSHYNPFYAGFGNRDTVHICLFVRVLYGEHFDITIKHFNVQFLFFGTIGLSCVCSYRNS